MSKSGLLRSTEIAANVVFIIVVLFLGALLIKRQFYSSPRETSPPGGESKILTDGQTKLPLAEVDWKRSDLTLVLVLNEQCKFCSASGEFYRRLTEAARSRQVPVVAALPGDAEESQRYLSSLGLSIPAVRRATPQTLGVPGTPTLILVNGEGTVVDAWVGKLKAPEEDEVLKRLEARKATPEPVSEDKAERLDPDKLKSLLDAGGNVVLLDIRERADYRLEHIRGALNIPYDELEVRAVNEINPSDAVVTYSRWGDTLMPEEARRALQTFGFNKVFVLKGDLDRWRQVGFAVDPSPK